MFHFNYVINQCLLITSSLHFFLVSKSFSIYVTNVNDLNAQLTALNYTAELESSSFFDIYFPVNLIERQLDLRNFSDWVAKKKKSFPITLKKNKGIKVTASPICLSQPEGKYFFLRFSFFSLNIYKRDEKSIIDSSSTLELLKCYHNLSSLNVSSMLKENRSSELLTNFKSIF